MLNQPACTVYGVLWGTSEPRYFSYSELYLRLYGEELSVAQASPKLRTSLNRFRDKLEADGHPRVIGSARRRGFLWRFNNDAQQPQK